MNDQERYKIMANESNGIVADIGGADNPNPFLNKNKNVLGVIGIDLEEHPKANDYAGWIKQNIEDGIPASDNSIDTIHAGELIEHLNNYVAFLKECIRTLKIKGKLIISTPNAYQPINILINLIKSTSFESKNRKGYFLNHVAILGQKQLRETAWALGFKFLRIYGLPFSPQIILVFELEEKGLERKQLYETR